MARKVCPACKKLNGGSATECSCGHTFEASSIVAARRTTKRCPSCQVELPRLRQQCGCGYAFSDIAELRDELVSRVHLGWWYMALGAVIVAGTVGAFLMGVSVLFIFASFFGVTLGVRGLTMRVDALSVLRDIGKSARSLPSAKIVR
ncbi:MAG: hypothetical protein JWO36_3408 [Myxococcales bacterium]|nr:hypothetical protein [Myxococcales bacterium]